jgi:predicted nucleic acid-binding protein
VKLLIPEPGAAEVAEAWRNADRRVSSLVLYPEAWAAMARARRLDRLTARQLGIARDRVDALWTVVDRIALTETLARRAGELAERHELRAYDAVHLASLERVGDAETVLVSADVDLLEAAASIGFATLRPTR